MIGRRSDKLFRLYELKGYGLWASRILLGPRCRSVCQGKVTSAVKINRSKFARMKFRTSHELAYVLLLLGDIFGALQCQTFENVRIFEPRCIL